MKISFPVNVLLASIVSLSSTYTECIFTPKRNQRLEQWPWSASCPAYQEQWADRHAVPPELAGATQLQAAVNVNSQLRGIYVYSICT
jgi:hypothetical protein